MPSPTKLSTSSKASLRGGLPSSNQHSNSPCCAVPSTEQPPDAVLWYCCGCGFGPMDQALYVACINCDHRGCSNCSSGSPSKQESHTSDNRQLQAETNIMSASWCVAPLDDNANPSDTSALCLTVADLTSHVSEYFLERDIKWYCCKCGDGPKSSSLQPSCIGCGHIRCSGCGVD